MTNRQSVLGLALAIFNITQCLKSLVKVALVIPFKKWGTSLFW